MSDAVDPIAVGDSVVYTITVSNIGNQLAEDVVMIDVFPGGVTFVSAISSQGNCSEISNVVTCNLGTIENGAAVSVTIIGKTTVEGIITNTASVTSSTSDSNNNNNSTSEQTTVIILSQTADLSILKSGLSDTVTVGDNITYTITVTNNGSDEAEEVVLTDNLPGNVSFILTTFTQGNCSTANEVVTCNMGSISNGGHAVVTIVVKTILEGTITNIASVTSSTFDPDSNNNSASEQTTAIRLSMADLSITKNDTIDPVAVGDSINYTITVTNNGPETAKSVVMTDQLPGGVSFISASSSQGSCVESNGEVTCNLGDIANGESATATIIVIANTDGQITNTASVTSPLAILPIQLQ